MRKALYILGQLEDQDIEWLISAGRRQLVPRGANLIREGEPLTTLFLVLDGAFSVTARVLDDREVGHIGSGEIVGEMSFVDERPPSATVTALRDSQVLAISRDRLATKIARDTAFAARFYRALAVFLSHRIRQRATHPVHLEMADDLDEDAEYMDELDPGVLDHVHLAGARFDRIVQRLLQV